MNGNVLLNSFYLSGHTLRFHPQIHLNPFVPVVAKVYDHKPILI